MSDLHPKPMIEVKTSHISEFDIIEVKPYAIWGDNWFRRLLLRLFKKEDYFDIHMDLGVYLIGNHRVITPNDILIHSNADKFIVTWKRGAHAVLEKLTPLKVTKIPDDIKSCYTLSGGNLAVLGCAFKEGQQ